MSCLGGASSGPCQDICHIVNVTYENSNTHLVLHDHTAKQSNREYMVDDHFPEVIRTPVKQHCVKEIPEVVAHRHQAVGEQTFDWLLKRNINEAVL